MKNLVCAACVAAILLVLAVPSWVSVPAQTYVYVPDNLPASGGTNVYPFGTNTEWRYQMRVDAAWLPTSPFRILEVAIAAGKTGTFTASQCQIRMAHTTIANFQNDKVFATNLGPCPTQVFNGPLSFPATASQWCNLGLSGSFGHDGTRNLLIEIRFQAGSGNVSVRSATASVLSVRRLWASGTGAYTATSGNVDSITATGAAKLRLTIDPTTVLLAPDTVRLGTKAVIRLVQARAGEYYQMAASLGQMPLGLGAYTVNLAPDNVFIYSVVYGAPIFHSYAGVVNAQGSAFGTFIPPNIPVLVGVCVYHAAVTYDKAGLTGASNTAGLQLVP